MFLDVNIVSGHRRWEVLALINTKMWFRYGIRKLSDLGRRKTKQQAKSVCVRQEAKEKQDGTYDLFGLFYTGFDLTLSVKVFCVAFKLALAQQWKEGPGIELLYVRSWHGAGQFAQTRESTFRRRKPAVDRVIVSEIHFYLF